VVHCGAYHRSVAFSSCSPPAAGRNPRSLPFSHPVRFGTCFRVSDLPVPGRAFHLALVAPPTSCSLRLNVGTAIGRGYMSTNRKKPCVLCWAFCFGCLGNNGWGWGGGLKGRGGGKDHSLCTSVSEKDSPKKRAAFLYPFFPPFSWLPPAGGPSFTLLRPLPGGDTARTVRFFPP